MSYNVAGPQMTVHHGQRSSRSRQALFEQFEHEVAYDYRVHNYACTEHQITAYYVHGIQGKKAHCGPE
jgi:hypothetical protein